MAAKLSLRHLQLWLRYPLRQRIQIFTNINSTIVDPKILTTTVCRLHRRRLYHSANSFALARTVEYFHPAQCAHRRGKSTYARCGIIVNVTPFEPEWEGYVTLEFSNTTPLPAKIYAGEGCAQVLFFESDECAEPAIKIAAASTKARWASPCPRPERGRWPSAERANRRRGLSAAVPSWSMLGKESPELGPRLNGASAPLRLRHFFNANSGFPLAFFR